MSPPGHEVNHFHIPSHIGHNHRTFPSGSGVNSIMHLPRTPPFVIRHTSILPCPPQAGRRRIVSFPKISLHLCQWLLQRRPAPQMFQSQFGDVPPARPRRLARPRSEIVHQFFEGDIRLLQYRLQRFRFDPPVHRHAGMQSVFLVMTMGPRLPDKFKTQAFQCPADFIPGQVAGKFHAT